MGAPATYQSSKAGTLNQGSATDSMPVCKILCVSVCVCMCVCVYLNFPGDSPELHQILKEEQNG